MAPSECLPGSSFCAKAPRVQVPPMPLPLTLTRDNSLEVAGATGILSALVAALLLAHVSRRRRKSTLDDPGGGIAGQPEPAARLQSVSSPSSAPASKGRKKKKHAAAEEEGLESLLLSRSPSATSVPASSRKAAAAACPSPGPKPQKQGRPVKPAKTPPSVTAAVATWADDDIEPRSTMGRDAATEDEQLEAAIRASLLDQAMHAAPSAPPAPAPAPSEGQPPPSSLKGLWNVCTQAGEVIHLPALSRPFDAQAVYSF